MEIGELIKHRLEALGHEQRDLAAAAAVTESYVSQLLTGKKSLPAASRSDIYDKFETFLMMPPGTLAKFAETQRLAALRTKIAEPAAPLFKEIRELILHKANNAQAQQLRSMFSKEPFGEIERLITQKLLDVAQEVVRQEWKNENWLRVLARLNHTSYEEMRVVVLEFLDTDVLDLSVQNFIDFLDPLIKSWDIDLTTFAMTVVFSAELGREQSKHFEFVEKKTRSPVNPGSADGFLEFLQNPAMSGDANQEEIEFLKRLRFKNKKPTALYYYRELQNFRDPLHFKN
jgi:transcriptional regulator with XRE-family HTH domain